ncbi:adenosine receptor A3-like [Orbicella faveolata]|uniref:adenosine receptor A3-like n=1 Tax=Orbicella faveolata TaxID=48498 RepID=UPI0009E30EC2|nr:adenosine receptor A3-like [Orbicella faveolata]
MVSSSSDFVTKDSNHAPEVFFCPTKPIFTWILSDTSTFQATISISCIACPITVFLNILVIIAVKKRKEFQTNSNTLLANLAAADLLVGAVSMPLTIALDALLLQKVVGYWICRLAFTNQLVLYAAVCSSLYHMTLIAWERYVATRKWNCYKAIVTKRRVKTYTAIAWLLAVLTTTPVRILTVLGLDYKYTKILDTIFFLPALVCLVLIGYFYIMLYLGVRAWKKISDVSQLGAPTEMAARRELGIAKRVFIQTVAMLIFYLPSSIVLFCGEFLPFLRTSSFFRRSELLNQLNSLVNPFLYVLALKRFRKAVLGMLKMGRKPGVQGAAVRKRRLKTFGRRIGVVENLEVVLECEQVQDDVFVGSGSGCSDTPKGTVNVIHLEPILERCVASTLPCEISQIIHVDVHQPKTNRRKPRRKANGVVTRVIPTDASFNVCDTISQDNH